MYRRFAPLAATIPLALLACTMQRDGRAGSGAPPPNVVTVTASSYHFAAPDTVPAGLTTLHLVTQGAEAHQVALMRISGGKTFADFLAAIKQPGPPPPWVTPAGGVNPPRPGDSANAMIVLEPGTYALLCFLPAADGVPHVVKGMFKELTVVRSDKPSAAEPVTPDTLTLSDYAFTASAPITAGEHTFMVRNLGPQPHEIMFVRLMPGSTAVQAAAWFEKPVGPPPGEALSGVFALSAGQHAFFTIAFTPGEYALICFIPDAKDAAPHFAHGMIRQITVK
jgi:hypothetical protein